ncbi:hypothetical protein GGD56_001727 [Rhizobium mongolense]|jgi:hypothetical protein|uniref:Transposase n=1 Tax=Rhizobium mongolense TaxID=57676 RepID=A0ABR6IJ51_9HYPH|nr:hypothetical protein [Rhizobium mongolense]
MLARPHSIEGAPYLTEEQCQWWIAESLRRGKATCLKRT